MCFSRWFYHREVNPSSFSWSIRTAGYHVNVKLPRDVINVGILDQKLFYY
jgi:hypothetical protein